MLREMIRMKKEKTRRKRKKLISLSDFVTFFYSNAEKKAKMFQCANDA